MWTQCLGFFIGLERCTSCNSLKFLINLHPLTFFNEEPIKFNTSSWCFAGLVNSFILCELYVSLRCLERPCLLQYLLIRFKALKNPSMTIYSKRNTSKFWPPLLWSHKYSRFQAFSKYPSYFSLNWSSNLAIVLYTELCITITSFFPVNNCIHHLYLEYYYCKSFIHKFV